MEISNKFEEYKNKLLNIRTDKIQKIKDLRNEQKEISPNDYKKMNEFGNKIDVLIEDILNIENTIRIIREPNKEDLESRIDVMNNFESNVNGLVPSSYTVIYKGISNIEEVDALIKSRGKIFISRDDFNDPYGIKGAEPGIDSFKPYGAIFVFISRDEQKRTAYDLKNDSYLLSAIITTDENIDKLVEGCNFSGLDRRKVMNHEQFVEYLNSKYERSRKEIVLPM